MQEAIDYFLNCTARWTPRWFNKPKFHIVLHLPEHIRRFGPAMLFATEGFESFNAVIRSHSIHSNHRALTRRAHARLANRVLQVLDEDVLIGNRQTLSCAGVSETKSKC